MRLVAMALLGVLAACGRVGFDAQGAAGGDALVVYSDAPLDLMLPSIAPTVVVPAEVIGTASIAWDGDGYGIAWQQVGTPYSKIYFMRLDRDGVPLTAPLLVWDGSTASALPEVFAGDGRYGVGWRFGGASAFQLISAQGTPIAADYHSTVAGINQPTGLEFGTTSTGCTMIWGGTILNNQTIYYSTFDGLGTTTVESQVLDAGATLSMLTSRPYWNGTAWVVAGDTYSEIWSRRFADLPIGNAVRLDTTADSSSGPQLIQTATGMAAVWVDTISSTNHPLIYRALDRDGVPTAAPVTITSWPTKPTIAVFKQTASGSELVLADQTAFTRLALDGGGMLAGEPTPVPALVPPAGLGKSGPGLAIVWVEASKLWFQRLE